MYIFAMVVILVVFFIMGISVVNYVARVRRQITALEIKLAKSEMFVGPAHTLLDFKRPCGRACNKHGCDEPCHEPEGHSGYCSCPGPNGVAKKFYGPGEDVWETDRKNWLAAFSRTRG